MSPKTLAYLDTSVLLMMMGYDAPDSDQRRTINRLLESHTIKIPQIVLGEALAVILRDAPNDDQIQQHQSEIDRIRKKIELDDDQFPPTTDDIIDIACDIRQFEDSRIKNMDSLIVAHAIEDNDATYFYTLDKELKNPSIQSYIKTRISSGKRTSGLKMPTDLSTL